jgi:pimeloyl-ACP methyl ester carboxylesterase
MTHGLNGSPSDWAEYMAQIIQTRIGKNAVNLVAWDWSAEAQAPLYDVGVIARKAPGEGNALGANLIAALGANYSQRIHFIGHSLGTLVNAAAADYVHTHGFSWTNTQMTLCDDAEIAWGLSGSKLQISTTLPSTIGQDGNTLFILYGNSSNPQPLWGSPLPKQFVWADNYVSAVGQLHPEAGNVILTYTYPSSAPDLSTWWTEWLNFHDYSHYFYEDTIEPGIFNTGGQINATYMGFICSFEGGDIAGRPATNTVFYQDPNGLELNLVQTDFNFATNFLNARLKSVLGTLAGSEANFAVDHPIQAAGQVTGAIDNVGNWIVNLITSIGNGSLVQGSAHPLGGPMPNGSSSSNSPADAWLPLNVPSTVVSMSFDFMLQGDGNNDSFQAALNGTNVLSLETVLIRTNVTMNSGLIDVSRYAGTNVELFLGIVGGTSTNAQLTVSDIQFYSAALPLLQAQAGGGNFALSWPLSAANFSVQTTTNLTDPNSWVTLTNVPAIVNLQNAVTNPVSGGAQFYRLKK